MSVHVIGNYVNSNNSIISKEIDLRLKPVKEMNWKLKRDSS